MPLPSDDAILVHRYTDEVRRLWITPRTFWPSPHRQAFYVNGRLRGERQEPGNVTVAHGAPVYAIVEGRPFYRDDQVPELVALQRSRLRELLAATVDPNGDLEPWETRSLLSELWPGQRRLLEPRVAEADARYRALLAAVADAQR